jgi:murein DD-endopeptidase MepM/ murein hydrolase activator NlpD
MVEINHGNGYSTRYAHNSENRVSAGDEVKKGQVVALMGKTGRATGPNLHFEVLRNGRRVNPVNFIRESSK